jgi:hypothetical protein
VTDPIRALSALAGEVVGLKDWLGERLSELGSEEWISRTKLGAEQVSAWTQAYERSLDRCARVLIDVARLDLDERILRLDQAEAVLLAEAMGAAFDRCGLPHEWRLIVAKALADGDSSEVSMSRVLDEGAAVLERLLGLPCGVCGERHSNGPDDRDGETCSCCAPCLRDLVQTLAEQFPEIVGSARVITREMFEEAITRMEAEIADMDRELEGHVPPSAP